MWVTSDNEWKKENNNAILTYLADSGFSALVRIPQEKALFLAA